ncbi:immunoglobulin A1 protease autotransporter-like [Ptychodera flava]|uniref:immunoglobulin A1 protease autotransporter-like n=1 Tax=Ptychodera flava TaxID=63121 RepID=UPI00396A64A8
MNGNHSDKEEDFRIPDALDALFRNTEQTYEEFLNSFTTLTAEDVAGFHLRNAERLNSATAQTQDTGTSTAVNLTDDDKIQTLQSSDDLQEEVLEEGTRAPTFLMRTPDTTGGTLLKVDNFVEDEGAVSSSEDSDELNSDTDIPYQPSCLGEGKQTRTDAEKVHGKTLNDNESKTSDSSAQEGEPINPVTGQRMSNQDNTRVLNISEMKTSETSVDTEAVFGEETVDTEKSIDERKLELSNLENVTQVDSDTESHEVRPLPGEAEDIPPSPTQCQMTKQTLLEMASTSLRETSGQHAAITEEVSNDDVQPFSLHEDFDYDNVTC